MGDIRVFCPDTVICECVHILHGYQRVPRRPVAQVLKDLVNAPGLVMANKSAILAALEFWVAQPPLDFADCYHLALTHALGLSAIDTFDKKMHRFPGVARLEP